MLPCQQEGQFRARIKRYLLTEAKSGAVGIRLSAELFQEPGVEGGWVDLDEALETEGTVWVIKKDGQINDRAFESLMNHTGWDGNLESVANQSWQPTPCAVLVKKEEYEGNTSYKIAFINSYEAVPTMGLARARELQLKFGAKLQRAGGAVNPGVGSPMAPPPGPEEKDIPF